MSKRNNAFLLNDMLEYAERAYSYVENMSAEAFYMDSKTIDAVTRCLEVIGEACTHVTDDAKALAPEVPWHRVKGFRNRVIHEYFDINLEMLWTISRHQLPELINQLKQLLIVVEGKSA